MVVPTTDTKISTVKSKYKSGINNLGSYRGFYDGIPSTGEIKFSNLQNKGYVFDENQSGVSLNSGTLTGAATYSQGLYTQLTPAVNGTSGVVYWQSRNGAKWICTFEFFAGGGNGADATWMFAFRPSNPASTAYNNEQDIFGGYTFAADEWNGNTYQIHGPQNGLVAAPSPAVGAGNYVAHVVAGYAIADSTWRTMRVEFTALNPITNNIKMFINNALILETNHTPPVGANISTSRNDLFLGFGGRTGGLNNIHRVRNMSMYIVDEIRCIFDNLSAAAKSSCVGAFSLARVSRTYFGPSVRIRRSTDNAEADFYGDPLGNLGLGINATSTSLTSWLNGATGFVRTWYDQSGQGKHATQTNTALQPIVSQSSYWIDFKYSDANGRYMNLPDGTVPSGNSSYTVIVKHGSITGPSNLPSNGGWLSGGSGAYNQANNFRRKADGYWNYWWNIDAGIDTTVTSGNVVTWRYDGANRFGSVNSSLFSVTPSSNRNSTTVNNRIGTTIVNEHLNGELYYLFIFNASLAVRDQHCLELPPRSFHISKFRIKHPSLGTYWRYNAATDEIKLNTGNIMIMEIDYRTDTYASSANRIAIKDTATGNYVRHRDFIMRVNGFVSNNYDFAYIFRNTTGLAEGSYRLYNDYPNGIGSYASGNYYIGYDSASDTARIYAVGSGSIVNWVVEVI